MCGHSVDFLFHEALVEGIQNKYKKAQGIILKIITEKV